MRQKIKKIAGLLLAAVIMLCTSGCAEMIGLEAQSLMAPPKTTADRQAIYALMSRGEQDVKLVYPRNGEYRSAVIARDLNGDEGREVVSFCMNSEAGGIRLQFFSQDENGTWYSLAEFISAANQVDRVFFGDLTGDGQEEVVIGWGDPLTATASISVYHLYGSAMQELPMSAQAYSEMLLTDFDDDAVRELFVLEVAGQPEADGTVTAPLGKLFRFDGEQAYVAQTVPLDAAVTRYTSASFAPVNAWSHAVVADGVKADGHMMTQVIGYNEAAQVLVSPLSNMSAEDPNLTDRAAAVAVASRDINGDGRVEIPTAELMQEQEGTVPDSTGYCVTWNTYSLEDNRFTPVGRSIVNTAENYFVMLPAGEERIACVNDPVTRTATFFRYTKKDFNGLLVGREDLFLITVYTDEGWEEHHGGKNDDHLLASVAGRAYALTVVDGELNQNANFRKELEEGFKILSE